MIWHNARNLWMLNPAWDNDDHPDDLLLLRCRVVVHDEPPPTELHQKVSQGWRGQLEQPRTHQ
jgi:hypothetical protein